MRFRQGAKGFLVEDLQRAIGVRPDGVYGPKTAEAVQGLQDSLAAKGQAAGGMGPIMAPRGEAGAAEFAGCGLVWPSLFYRCLNLTSCFEGTGFVEAVGPAQTGDTAGVTYGIVGFTSYNGELQMFLRKMMTTMGQRFVSAVDASFADMQDRKMVGALIARSTPAVRFAEWALDANDSVRPEAKEFFRRLGQDRACRASQVSAAKERYWALAAEQAKRLIGGDEAAWELQSQTRRFVALLFDTAVQNGGLKQAELAGLESLKKAQALTPFALGWEVIATLNTRLKQAKRPPAIIVDVMRRKSTIADGAGVVHKANYNLEAFAL